ncbi:MFS transporter [Streptomyces sp. 8N706]|uniref:MFS transporter n=1 Tax=Streptomyces sp. 8N706 TaxID=3457416 RepID=UPI003FD1D0BB
MYIHGYGDGVPESSDTPRETPAPSAASLRATTVATAVSVLLTLAIVLGSRLLRDVDAAQLPYTVATVFLAFGVAYRYTVWASAPAARRLVRQGMRGFFSTAGFRRAPAALPGMLATCLGFRRFGGPRARARWIAHQSVLWGCVLAALITFPLAWGWFTFTSVSSSGSGYALRLWGLEVAGFDSSALAGWAVFHVLDLAAVLVIAGSGYFLWRRIRDRGPVTGQRFAYDVVPLLVLIVISVSGLLLTFSSALLQGGGYEFLAILHMVSVVFGLICLPFGKFFHIVQRPATAGLQLATDTSRHHEPVLTCRRCAEPMATAPHIENLRGTMRELNLGFDACAEYCPACRRVLRGSAYLSQVKKGFR